MNKLISYLVIVSSGLILSTTTSQAASILLTSTQVESSPLNVDSDPDPGGDTLASGEVDPDPIELDPGTDEEIPLESSGGGENPSDSSGGSEFSGGDENPSASQPVPEPLTIIGSATALGIGALLKRESSKKKN